VWPVPHHTPRGLSTQLGFHSDPTDIHDTTADFVGGDSSGVISLGINTYYPSMTFATRSDFPQPWYYEEPTDPIGIDPENVAFMHYPGYTDIIAHQGDLNPQRGNGNEQAGIRLMTAISPERLWDETITRPRKRRLANQATDKNPIGSTLERFASRDRWKPRKFSRRKTERRATPSHLNPSLTDGNNAFPSSSFIGTTRSSLLAGTNLPSARSSLISQQGSLSEGTEPEMGGVLRDKSLRTEKTDGNVGSAFAYIPEVICVPRTGCFRQAGDTKCPAEVGVCPLRTTRDRNFRPEELGFAMWIVERSFDVNQGETLTFGQKLYHLKSIQVTRAGRPLSQIVKNSTERDRSVLFKYVAAFRAYNDKLHGDGSCRPCVKLKPSYYPSFKCKQGDLISEVATLLDDGYELLSDCLTTDGGPGLVELAELNRMMAGNTR
jgi:hypothetical protein